MPFMHHVVLSHGAVKCPTSPADYATLGTLNTSLLEHDIDARSAHAINTTTSA